MQSEPQKNERQQGFTLIELLLVIAILATLAAISVPIYSTYIQNIRIKLLHQTLRNMEQTILLYEQEHGQLPETLEEIGLNLLDPWGNPFQYISIRGKPLTGKGKVTPRKDKSLHPLNSDFDLWSMGPDGKTALPLTAKASHDDIIRAGDGSFIGTAEDY
ncbi:general secretion pathway protein G [Malonomonas rubra DSM 5091]|uniref:General secretion pathway protein G n=1 Tax=Malonomonas rubra DSM 5091 TaxID=1122189 RepID=A0A1M6G544_MALRU|nr:prepilin-type N-terminal cleavage/methylation domain-containing protein [Malonomonas rubra]SHJ05023.1 general secretion pathway protein G [Malonomonas rubra DSM 5091]